MSRAGYVCLDVCTLEECGRGVVEEARGEVSSLLCTRSEEDLVEAGFVVEAMPPGRLNPHGDARKNIDVYKQRRLAAHVKHRGRSSKKRGRSPSASLSASETSEPTAATPSSEEGVRRPSSDPKTKKLKTAMNDSSAEALKATPLDQDPPLAAPRPQSSQVLPRLSVCDLLFSDVVLRQVRALFESIYADRGETYDGTSAYLFNEQYIVKPPRCGRSQFGWHTDRQEQLKMVQSLFGGLPTPTPTLTPADAARSPPLSAGDGERKLSSGVEATPSTAAPGDTLPPYVSVWFPLDDVTEENGPLWILPLHVTAGMTHLSDDAISSSPELMRRKAVVAPRAGTAVVFRDDLWHCSPPNRSPRARRVLYFQYSSRPVLVGSGRDRGPLSLAVGIPHPRSDFAGISRSDPIDTSHSESVDTPHSESVGISHSD